MTVDDELDRKQLNIDAPKLSMDEDEFGLEKIVAAVAETLTRRVPSAGYCLGIEGAWGSGKSTLANFVAEKVSKLSPDHHIVRFNPWVVGEKNAVLPFLLGQLATKIESIESAAMSWWRLDYWIFTRFRRTLSAKVRKYGKYSAVLATPVSSLAGLDPTGTVGLTAAGLKGVGFIQRLLDSTAQTLDRLKNDIQNDLRKLDRRFPGTRFIVFIDDTDRLEPREAAEVLRLIRSVADFPLIAYVVCFDAKVLS